MIGALITAWILSLFGINEMLIEVFQPFVQVKLTNSHYYVTFMLIGLLLEILNYIRRWLGEICRFSKRD